MLFITILLKKNASTWLNAKIELPLLTANVLEVSCTNLNWSYVFSDLVIYFNYFFQVYTDSHLVGNLALPPAVQVEFEGETWDSE